MKDLGAVGHVVAAVTVSAPSKKQCTNDRTTAIQHKEDGNREQDRVSVLQTNGTVKQFRTSRLVPIYDFNSNNTTIVLTPDTTNYRQLAIAHLRKDDKVLEIGCSTGMCTSLVLRRMLLLASVAENTEDKEHHGQIVAFDTGSDMIQQTQQALQTEFTNLSPRLSRKLELSTISSVHKVDAFADPRGAYTLTTKNNKHPDIVLIDIGGNRELEGVTRMIHWVQTTYTEHPPRVIIVKSKELARQLNANTDGVIHNAQSWLTDYLQSNNMSNECATKPPTFSHPLQAPLVLSPEDDTTPICRFHNYHKEGCKKHQNGNDCELDHEHCHFCKKKGHVANECPGI